MQADQTTHRTTKRTAMIVGATGLVGAQLLKRLAESQGYAQIHVLARRSPEVSGDNIQLHRCEFDQLHALVGDKPEAFAVDDVFCCLGTTLKTAGSKAAFETVDYEYVLSIARACEEHGAQRFFLLSAVGANPESSNFYSRTKGRIEVAVSQLGFSAVYWIRPSLLLGERSEHRAGEAWAQRLAPVFSPLLAGPLRNLRPVSAEHVAEHIIKLAEVKQAGQHITYPSRD